MEFQHAPVLLHECIEALDIKPDGIYLDGTLGGAGHSREIASRLSEHGMLIGVDRDPAALQAAGERLSATKARILLVHENFQNLRDILNQAGVERIDGMLFDLGVSSPQLDEAERGFSYMNDAPLDMRMNPEDRLSAYEVVNDWPQEELKRILFEYGEERYAPLIAAAIVRERAKKPIETTLELAGIIRSAMPAQALREKQHPAKRSFQAIRIAVNDELGAVERMMEAAPDLLNPGGRLAVITFHSLEDRIVKRCFKTMENPCIWPPKAPICTCGRKPVVKVLAGGAVAPTAEETERNPRARSAKLRVAEKRETEA